MVDYRDSYESRSTTPYEDMEKTSFAGPIIALIVIALLIGGVFFLSGGSPDTSVTTGATGPAATETAPAAPVKEPLVPQPAAPATAQ